jgi:hypothetical protein
MNILQRIKAKTPPKDKRKGQVLTVLSGTSIAIAQSGLVDNRPMIKEGLNLLGGFLANAALNKAQKVQR